MPEIIRLKELLQTGRLDKMYFGQIQNEIIALLGSPDYVRTTGDTTLCSYGDLELYFTEKPKRWTGLNINYLSFWQRQFPSGSDSLLIDPWVLKAGLLPNEFIICLQQENIDYSETEPVNFATRQFLVNETVTVIFNETGNEIGLCKLWAGN